MKELPESELVDRLHEAASQTWGASADALVVQEIERLHGGVSSLTYRAKVANAPEGYTSWVVKVAPPGLKPVRNRDVLRQSRVMRYVNEAGAVPVPRILFEADGAPPMFAMEYSPGQSYEPLLDEETDPPSPETVARRATAAARALARLQQINTGELHTFESVIDLHDELERWARLLSTVPDNIVARHDELYRALAQRVPEGIDPVLVHGDYRLANMMFSGPELEGIIDWEIWSLGDPRIDLAWLIMHNDPAHQFVANRSPANQLAGTGMPPSAELLTQYRSEGGSAGNAELGWFLAYSYYKVASTLSVIVKRNINNLAEEPHLAVAARSLPDVVERGLRALNIS